MKKTLIEADVIMRDNSGHVLTRKAPIHEEHTIIISKYIPDQGVSKVHTKNSKQK